MERHKGFLVAQLVRNVIQSCWTKFLVKNGFMIPDLLGFTLSETNISRIPLKIGLPNRKFHLPTIHFQGRLLLVLERVCMIISGIIR